MADNVLQLLFKADTSELDQAKEKLTDIGKEMPSVGDMVSGLIDKFKNIPGPVGLGVAALGGFGFALESMVKSAIQAETALYDLSEAVGIPVEKLQPFAQAMALAGISGDRLQQSLSKLSQSIGQALEQPTGKAADAFKKLGISQDELKNGDIEQIMKDAAKGLDQYADSATKTATIRALFGKQGPQIVAAMRDEAQFEAMAADAQKQYGTAISETDAKSAKYFGETLKLGMSMFEGVGISVTKSLLPGLQELVTQFADSGKQGGFLRDVLDGLEATISVVGKVILTALYEPIAAIILVFKQAGTTIGATFAAIAAAAHGNLGEAKQIMSDLGSQLKTMTKEYEDNAEKFESALWKGTSAVQEQGKAVDDTRPKFEAYDAAGIKVANTLDELQAKLVAQRAEWTAAAQGLDQYKKAQDEIAISVEKLKLVQEGATKGQVAQAEAAMRATLSAKQGTDDEVAGWNLINSLRATNIGLITHQTQLEKDLEEIAKHPGMTQAEKAEAAALAESNSTLREKDALTKAISALDQMVTKDITSQTAAMTLSTNELKLYNQQLALKQKYDNEMQGKSVPEQKQLAEAYQKNLQLIEQNNQQTQQWTQSMTGFGAGAYQAIQTAYEQATNLNKLGSQLVTTFNTDLANAFIKMAQGGKDAFAQLLASVGQMIAQQVMKFAITQVELAALEMFGITGPAAAALLGAPATKNAKGNAFNSGSIMAFADGGIVNQPTYFNMGLMGEAGPEAIMPLQRDSQGRLGISSAGGNSSSPGETHYHAPSVTINSNQDPHEIAKQVKKQVNLHQAITRTEIQRQQRPGGMLHNQQPMFSG